MRIAILTVPDHYYANYVLKRLLMVFGREIVGVFESETLLPGHSFATALRKYLQVSGFCYVFWQGMKQMLFKAGQLGYSWQKNSDSPFYSYKRLAVKNSIPILHARNINSDSSRKQLESFHPDLLVSVFFNQILKGPTLRVASRGCINIHPAYLPCYRGVSPVFWSIANGERSAGVTIHCIDERIDTGQILAQQWISIARGETEHSLYCKCCQVGAPLLIETVRQFCKARLGEIQRDLGAEKVFPSYFSIPTKEAVRRYCDGGRPFFNLHELLGSFEFPLD